jgi:hypothetical protein
VAASKAEELLDELRQVVLGEGTLADTVIPTVVFLIVNGLLGLEYAMWASLMMAVVISLVRWRRGQPIRFAVGGIGGVAVAILLSRAVGRQEGFYLPTIASGALVFLLTLGSVFVRRPLVAWTSHLARRWPRAWYWHPLVRPAYSEVTLFWAVVFGLRLWGQVLLFRAQVPERFALFSTLGGWPTTLLLLVLSYLYGTWRLRRLRGPSVEEFKAGAPAPWDGQQRGF